MFMVNNSSGTTLIEMMATLAIISVLAVGILPLSQVVYKRTKEVELRSNLRIIRTAIDEYKQLADDGVIPVDADSTGYPATLESLVLGVDLRTADKTRRKFLRRIPRDPFTEDGEWGMRSYADPPDSTSWGGQDLYDVYTKSDKQALDGTYYNKW